MGPAHRALRLPERLRPWSALGVDAILCPAGLPQSSTHNASHATPTPKPGRSGHEPAADPRASPASPSSAPAQGPSAHTSAGTSSAQSDAPPSFAASHAVSGQDSPQQSRDTHQPRLRYDALQRPAPEATGPADVLPGVPRGYAPPVPEDAPLPERWVTHLSQYQPGVAMLWTYYEMGLNLWGARNPKRSELFGQLIACLGLPKGSIGFCPMTEPAGDVLVERPAYFWKAAEQLGATVIACFGERSFRALCPRAPRGLVHITPSGHVVHVLHGPDAMLSMAQDERIRCVARLREAVD